MYLFDTDTLSNLLTKRPSAKLLRRLAQTPADQQYTSTITVGELYYGVYKSPRASEFRGRLEQEVWPRVRIVTFDLKAAQVYGRLRAELEQRGQPLSDPDLMIAAIARSRNLTIITGNVKHFARVKGLNIENWL